MSKNKKSKGSGFGRFLIAVILAVIVFVALLIIQSNVMNKTKTVKVLVAKTEVAAKTDITKDNYKNYFDVVDRIEVQLPDQTVKEEKEIDGVTITNDMAKGEILNAKDFVKTEDFISFLGEDKVKVGFGLTDLPNLICGTLERGDVIDITVLYKDESQSGQPQATTLSNIVVEKAYDSAGVEISDENNVPATMFTFILTPEQNDVLNEMMTKDASVTRISKKTDITYGISNLVPKITTKTVSEKEANQVTEK